MYGTYYHKHPLSMKNTYQIHLVHSCPSSSHPHNTYRYSHPIQVPPRMHLHTYHAAISSHHTTMVHLVVIHQRGLLEQTCHHLIHHYTLQSNSSWDSTRV